MSDRPDRNGSGISKTEKKTFAEYRGRIRRVKTLKKGLRFIVALLTLASLGVGFIPVLELAGIRVSVVDVFKV